MTTAQAPPPCEAHVNIDIAASTDRVWTALTGATNSWWPDTARMTEPGSTVALEAKAGGRLHERSNDGQELLWATIVGVAPGTSLDGVGYLATRFGGPALTMLHVRLEATDDGATILHVTDAVIGNVSPKLATSIEGGWREIFTGLKQYVESSD